MTHPKDCRCSACRVCDPTDGACQKHPRCFARPDHSGPCTTLRHLPLVTLAVIADRIASVLR
jgi:hypothetical protein